MHFIDTDRDPWQRGDDPAEPVVAVPPRSHALMTLAQWRAVRAQWPAALPAGLLLDNDADVEVLADDLPRIALVALQFPKWTDGRAYSQAWLLRRRLGFTGELRATGEVLVDMLPLLQRCGFDTVLLRTDQDADAARRALGFFAGHYQRDNQARDNQARDKHRHTPRAPQSALDPRTAIAA